MEEGLIMSTAHHLMTLRDPRTSDWKALNPSFIVILLGGYLYMAKVWGPQFMKNRKAYELKGLIRIYNLFQIVSNIYFLHSIIYYSFWKAGYSLYCQGLTYKADENSMNLLNAYYWYFFVRVADFLDTLFFVLTKKFSHISVLHVTHHTIVVFNGWMFLRLGADGHTVFGVCLNAFVHIIMYVYYFLASLGPSIQKYLWWKKYLTRVQIVQFFIMIIHGCIPIFVDCGYPVMLLSIGIPQVILILGLFVNFYVQAYLNRSSGGPPKAPATSLKAENIEGRQNNGNYQNGKKDK